MTSTGRSRPTPPRKRRCTDETLLGHSCRAHALGSRTPNWRFPTADLVRECERDVELEGKLPALLSGEYKPTTAREKAEFGRVCAFKGYFITAAQLYAEAFAAEPDRNALEVSHQYIAACAAARAACGHDQHGLGPPAPQTLVHWRQRALEWLTADLAWLSRELEKDPAGWRPRVRETLRQWQTTPDLAELRDAAAVALLPETEREGWRTLWRDVEDVRNRTQGDND